VHTLPPWTCYQTATGITVDPVDEAACDAIGSLDQVGKRSFGLLFVLKFSKARDSHGKNSQKGPFCRRRAVKQS